MIFLKAQVYNFTKQSIYLSVDPESKDSEFLSSLLWKIFKLTENFQE